MSPRGFVAAVTALLLAALVTSFLAFCTTPGWQVVAHVSGDTPEARLAAYLDAVGQGDVEGAIETWHISGRPGMYEQLAARREQVTRDLARRRPTAVVERIEWWSTCCEPHVIDRRDYATAARAVVRLTFANGAEERYILDVLALNKMPLLDGLPARDWIVRDVHPPSEAPLYFTWPYRPPSR